MQPQQQTVMTTAPVVQPMYVVQPYQTANTVSAYSHVQSMIIGIALIIIGALSIIFNIVDLAIGTKDEYTLYSYRYNTETVSDQSNGVAGHGFWCGIPVSAMFCFKVFLNA